MPFYITNFGKNHREGNYQNYIASFSGIWYSGREAVLFKNLLLWERKKGEGCLVGPPFKIGKWNPWQYYLAFKAEVGEGLFASPALKILAGKLEPGDSRRLGREARRSSAGQGFEIQVEKFKLVRGKDHLAEFRVVLSSQEGKVTFNNFVLSGTKEKPSLSLRKEDPEPIRLMHYFSKPLLLRVQNAVKETYEKALKEKKPRSLRRPSIRLFL